MKLLSISVGLLLAALGIFFVPVSFSVDGFGLVVNPGGVRTVRAVENGQVLHFPSTDGKFTPGQIVTAVVFGDAVAKNGLLEGTLSRELAKVKTDYLDKYSKLFLDRERDNAKRIATAERLLALEVLTKSTSENIAKLQAFNVTSQSDIETLNQERMAQLAQLEDLLKRSGEVSALPAQKLATMLDSIQSSRLAVINSNATKFSSEKKVLDMVKELNKLLYSNSIDRAEIKILSDRLTNLDLQMSELDALRETQISEAAARYLAKAVLPQVAVADGLALDMRTLQASRADVAKNDPLRLLANENPAQGLSLLVYGVPKQGTVLLRHGDRAIMLELPINPSQATKALRAGGLRVAQIHTDRQIAGSFEISSIFIQLENDPQDRLSVISAKASNDRGVPVMVATTIIQATPSTPQTQSQSNEIIGFLENRHAVALVPGQRLRGSISDSKTGSEIVFEAVLLNRDFATVDTKELGIRLGNQSLAAKIIKRGVLSQVVVGVDESSARQIENLPGAVVHLSFPLARQSLFSFLMARDASI